MRTIFFTLLVVLGLNGCAGSSDGLSLQQVLVNEQIPGNYTLQDGTALTIDGNGAITSSSFSASITVLHWPNLNSMKIDNAQGTSPLQDGFTTYDHSQEPATLTIGQTVLTKVP